MYIVSHQTRNMAFVQAVYNLSTCTGGFYFSLLHNRSNSFIVRYPLLNKFPFAFFPHTQFQQAVATLFNIKKAANAFIKR